MTISFSGLASGLDTSSWVESLVALKQAKIDTLEEEKETVLLSQETLNEIKSFFSSFRTVIEKITDAQFGIPTIDLFAQNIATSANLDILTATATTEAEEAEYNVQVNQLATNTAANSNFSYMTTIVQTTTASADSKLINLGIKAGNIGVTVNGVERGITITENDTVQSFIDKLNAIGVNASYNEKTGLFSMDIDANDINDIDNTGVIAGFHLEGVNEGYESDSLKTSTTDTVFSAATESTLLSELGVKNGVITVEANDASYNITINSNSTLGSLMQDFDKINVDTTLSNEGFFVIQDAKITNEGTTNFTDALGLEFDVYSNTQTSGDLSHETIITQVTTATSDTLLTDLGNGINIANGQTVIIKNSNNEYSTITVGTTTTLGQLLEEMTNAGLYTALNADGTVEISGGTITGGTFDAIKALGLKVEPHSAMTTGKPLTETVQHAELVTLDTLLVDELKVRAGYLEVTDADGNTFYEKIYHGQTLGDFMSDLGNLGIYTKLRDDGVLEITGGAFATLSDDRVQELIANGTIRETDSRYQQGTDILTCLYGAPVISTDQITVASTYSKTQALTHQVTNTIMASLSTTLGNLGLSNGTAIFNVRGENRTVNVTQTDDIQSLINKLDAIGIEATWNQDNSRLTIENATINGGTSNLDDVLNLTETLSGKYVTSDSLSRKDTISVDATEDTRLAEFGITNSMSTSARTVKLYNSDGSLAGSITVNENTTIGDLLDFINSKNNISASLQDGILVIDNGYIENSTLETNMGLEAENKSSFAIGSIMTITTTAAVTGETTLGEIIKTLGTTAAVQSGYTLRFNSKELSVSANTTLNQLIDLIHHNGGTAYIDATGRLTITGGTLSGTVSSALGISSVTTTDSVSATGNTLWTTQEVFADLNTKLSDLGFTGNSTIIINDRLNNPTATINLSNTETLESVFQKLKDQGIDAIIANGVISMKSLEGKFITGTFATHLGITTQSTTEIVNTTSSSTAAVTFTGTLVADLTTGLGEIGAIKNTSDNIIIYDSEQKAIGTISNLTTNSTIQDMFDELAFYGIDGTITNGIISLYSGEGNYAAGNIMTNLGIGVRNAQNETFTIAETITSSIVITYTDAVTATRDTVISDFATLPVSGSAVIDILDQNSSTVTSITIDRETTVGVLFDQLALYGINAAITNGVIQLSSYEKNYAVDKTGNILSQLNIGTQTINGTGTVGLIATSGSAVTYTDTVLATEDSLIGSVIDLSKGNTLIINNSNNRPTATVTVTDTMTFGDLIEILEQNNIGAKLLNGILSLNPETGNFVTGDVADALGIATIKYIGVGTGGGGGGGGGGTVQGGETADTAILGQLGYFLNTTTTILIKSSDGAIIAEQQFYAYASIQDLIAFLQNNGITAYIENNILKLDNDNGIHAVDATTGGLLTQIGVGVTTKSVTTSFLTIVTSSSASAAIAIGGVDSLTAGNIYAISSLSDLNKLASMVNSGQASNCTFILTQDIDMDNTPGYIPIGTGAHKFNGTFYGNGHVIKNVSITQGSTTGVGIFGVTGNTARILDIGVENAIVSGGSNTGVIAGKSEGTITNCYVKGNIRINGGTGTGVIAGVSSNTISSSYTSGTINVTGYSQTGGFVGSSSGPILNSFAEGNITVTGGSNDFVGGFAGSIDAAVINASISGNITVTGNRLVGGFIGYNTAALNNIVMTAAVNITGTGDQVGGAVGGTTNSTNNIRAELSGTVSGRYNIGGAFGHVSSSSSSLSNIKVENMTINASGTDSIHSSTYGSSAGGIAGYAGNINNCVLNNITINAVHSFVGGVAGCAVGTINNTSASGIKINITANKAYANVTDLQYIGGIAGSATGDVTHNYADVDMTLSFDSNNDAEDTAYIRHIGGIAGDAIDVSNNKANFNLDLTVTGSAAGNEPYVQYVGGITGQLHNTALTSCTVDSDINLHGKYGQIRYIGGIFGSFNAYSNNLNMSSLSSDTTITIEDASDMDRIGGIAGEIGGNTISLTGTSSNFELSFTSSSSTNWSNYINIGGLVGYLDGGISSITNAAVTADINMWYGESIGGLIGNSRGTISVSNSTADFKLVMENGRYIGGITGYTDTNNNSTIMNCATSVEMNLTYGYDIGGINGYYGNILNSNAEGSITITTSGHHIGGLIGSQGPAYSATCISDSHASVDLNIADGEYVGGLAGRMSQDITNSYATGNISGGADYVGGLVGSGDGNITNSYATGNISGGARIGGVVGENSSSSNYTNCYATGNISGNASVGGFIGNNYGYNNEFYTCYASGTVSGNSATGGFYGTTRTILNGDYVYYNSANTAEQSYLSSVTNSGGLSLTQLTDQATMEANGFTTAAGWIYETGKTPQLNVGTGKTTTTTTVTINNPTSVTVNVDDPTHNFYAILRPVNTNSDDLQDIIDNGIQIGGAADGGIAIETDTLGNVITFAEKYMTINIKSSDGAIIASAGFNTYSSIGELLKFLNDNGINAYMSNGVLYLDNDNGIYAEDAIAGGILSQMEIGVTTKSVTTSFLTIVTSSSASAAIAIGGVDSLTAGNIYAISSLSDLNKLASMVNSGQASNCTFILTQDIDMDNTPGYIPIGTGAHKFNGTFYGNGHVIKNVSITQGSTTGVGIFGVTGNTARILDIGVENAIVSGGSNTGVIAGKSEGTITNCYVKGNIRINGGTGTGVIAGVSSNTISSSYTSGTINVTGYSQTGGFVGSSSGPILNSFAEGNITVTGGSNDFVGGFAGSIDAAVINASISGNITVTGNRLVGGFIGYNTAALNNIVMTAAVNITGTGDQVGGAVGGTTNSTNNIRAELSGTVSGRYNIGGAFGHVSSSSSSLSNIKVENMTINASGTDSIHSSTYGSSAGGIAGYAGNINNCVLNNITINAVHSFVGGVAGCAVGTINNTSASGIKINITANKAYANVTDLQYIGGIAGSATGDVTHNYADVDMTLSFDSNNDAEDTAYIRHIGGIAGDAIDVSNNKANFNLDLTVTGSAAGNEPYVQYVGGITGQLHNTALTSCTVDSDINLHGKYGQIRYIGGIFGSFNAYSNNLNMSSLSSDTTITIEDASDMDRIGGIAGEIGGNTISLTGTSSNFELSFTSSSSTNWSNYINIGGLVGYLDGGISSITNAAVTADINMWYGESIGGLIGNSRGTISVSNSTADFKLVMENGRYIGGITGYTDTNNNSTIMNCATSVEMNLTYGYDIGGINGYYGNILNSNAEGSITITTSGHHIGGLIGSQGPAYSATCISDSHASVDLNIADGEYVGGLAGRMSQDITNSYATGNISGGADYVGGLVGSGDGNITNSYATGNISGGARIGGVVGENSSSSNYTNCYATGNISGNASVGGFIGNNYGYNNEFYTCYASGTVSGNSATGGFYGTTRTILNGDYVYYNSANTAEQSYLSSVTNSGGLSLTQLTDQATMEANGFTTAAGWIYETGKTPQLNVGTGKTTTTTTVTINNPTSVTVNVDDPTHNFYAILRPVNTNSCILYRYYEAGSGANAGSGGSGGGGGVVVVTIMMNSTSDLLSHDTVLNMDTSTLFELLGLGDAETGYITVVSDNTEYIVTVKSSDTIDDLISTLGGFDIAGSVHDGKLSLVGGEQSFVEGMSQNVKDILNFTTGEGHTYQSGVGDYIANTESKNLTHNTVVTMTTSSTLAKLGMTANGTITVVSDGTQYVVTVTTDKTIDDIISTLAGFGIAGSVDNGKLTFRGSNGSYIQGISTNLENTLALQAGQNHSWTTDVDKTWINTDSNKLLDEKNDIAITEDTILSSINGFNNGNGRLVIHQTDGKFVTITVDSSSTLSEFFTQISKYGLVGNVDSEGKVSIEGIGNVYMQAVSGGTNLLTSLKLSNVIYNVQTVTVNRTSNVLSQTVTVAATGTTQLGNLADSNGNTMGAGEGTIILQTTSDAGNQHVTLKFSRTQTLYDVIDKLAEYGIQASIDGTGRFSISGSTLTDFDISGNLGQLLMGAYDKNYGTSNTYNVSTNLIQTTTGPMTPDTLLANYGITSGNILITQQGVNYTVNIDTTQMKTVSDFMNFLAEYGFNSEIDAAGRLVVTSIGESYLTTLSGGSNILDVFGLTNWDMGTLTQTSDHLSDKETIVQETTLDTKLYELTDAAGNSLGITSGNIYVYQDGTRYLVNINNNDTLQTLAAKLSQYGINMELSSDGKLYFEGNNNSYMTTDGISSGASNLLQKINVLNNWSERYDSTSDNLSYTVKVNNVVNDSTKLSDLQDASGNNLGITEGSFYIYNNGVRNTETITADMTVNDLKALLAEHGLIVDITENGQISVGAYGNTYLATSAVAGQNSNLVSTLFAEWDFVNIYTSNNLEIPTDVIEAVGRDTKLADINEGTYQAGFITVVKDGVQTNIELTDDDTIGTLMDELALYGFESVLNENGQLIIKNTGNSLLQNYTGPGQASNALELLGIDLNSWIQTNSYESSTLNVITTSTIDAAVTMDTQLSLLGVTTGEYFIFNNGVKYTAYISTGETIGSFIETLKSFGIETSLVSDGDSSILTIKGSGDSYITKSTSTTNASNVVEKLFGNVTPDSSFEYSGLEQTSEIVTNIASATEDTLLSYFDRPWGTTTLKAEGNLSVKVNDENAVIEITADETFGSLIDKFEALGLEASISSDGQLMIQSGFDTFTINNDGTTSSLLATIGLKYNDDLGGYVASSVTTEATTTEIEEKTLSVANYAGFDTKMGLLNISDGTLSIYRNGEKAAIDIHSDETFTDLRSRIAAAFADVDITFEDGYLKFFSKDGNTIEVGATTDTSNFSAITGLTADGEGNVKSARELYSVNSDSVITNKGLFRRGDVTEGTFIIGNATFNITDTTTLADLISQINSSDGANATAYWDSIQGKLVVKSRTTGSALINIEAGTSNFTDIMGYTSTSWEADGDVDTTKMNVKTQNVGKNAMFTINGTAYTSASNTITSDISRIKGLTLNLKGLTEGESVTVTVERDKETLATAVSDIVDAYNELINNVDEAIAIGGQLHDQSLLKLIRNQLRTMMTSSDAGTTVFRNLDAIGIKVDSASANNITTEGITELTFDKDKFIQAYEADQDAVKALLIGSDTNTGVFTKVETLIESTLKSVTGYFDTADESYQREIDSIDNKIEKQERALERYRAQLEAKFASMDILIANMQQQYSSFLVT